MVSFASKKLVVFVALFLSLTFCVGGGQLAWAQEVMDVRASDKDTYSRLVFDSKGGADYTLATQKDALTFTFNKKAEAKIGGLSGIRNIGSVTIVSAKGEPLKIQVQIPEGSRYRDFKIGNRIVVDVYDQAGKEPKRSVPESGVQAQTTQPEVVETQSEEQEEPAESVEKEEPVESVESVEKEEPVEEPSQALLTDAAVITLSSSQNVGVAVFERAGYLWIVQDDPAVKMPPVVTGMEPPLEFEEIVVQGGKAYRTPMPIGGYFYAEGGGLLWRLIMTPNPRDKKTTQSEIREEKTAKGMIKRSLFWPLHNTSKYLSLTDPMIGDVIDVVTVADSAQTIGKARELVNFNILSSVVGMAYVAKSDDVTVQMDKAGLLLSSADGLAVSSSDETVSMNLKNDIEKEDEYFKKQENPDTMSRIYDFASWEMGGLKALEDNLNILQMGMARKEEAVRSGDLVTMAKLNLANNRGHEALGLLQVVQTDVQGIEETPEFLAMRGAAAALSGKYDEAIADLKAPSLERYDEIKYWQAMALAGVEDWQQAEAVMPLRFDILESYPAVIKEPLALSMAEIALRAGNVNTAESLLDMIESDFDAMSLDRQSAWKYLQGEKQRQANQSEEAMKNWEDLLTGKDDYYRAKAGLSVTKLQLDNQKITATKAIDRLEGLRYAWRGDELESLINYRLGSIYIDSGEYLKGLSVLRNAVGISPNTKISDEIADYMTDSFVKLFSEGGLSKVSPVDAVTIYDEFKELTPAGEEGGVFVQNLAERLIDVGLLARADALLEAQMNFNAQDKNHVAIALRLAAIRLLDNKPDGALRAIEVAEKAITVGQATALEAQEALLLKAKALAKQGQANAALSLIKNLTGSEVLSKLKADIAWNGGLWMDAAKAFGELIDFANISLTRPMDEYQENLVLNRAIALNLSNNVTAVAELRQTYGDLMKQSKKARIFDVVTLPKQLGVLENRDSIKSLISEVDLFGEFLNNYKEGKN